MKETGRSIETGSEHLGSSSKAKKQNKKTNAEKRGGRTDGRIDTASCRVA